MRAKEAIKELWRKGFFEKHRNSKEVNAAF